ncbi:MAG: hypothetical protein WBE26_00725, partial [Phycisphaerae bacterium]
IIELEYEGSEEELFQGDAMPSAASGWDVDHSTRKEGDEVKHTLTSTRRFEPGEELPCDFAAPDDPDADLYLDFPTTVRKQRRADGLYFYFHRIYTPRPWAYIQYWRDLFFDDNIKKLGEKPVEELTLDERVQIVEAFAGVEAFKQLEFTKIAMAESHPDLPVEHRLTARRALLHVYAEESDYFKQIIKLCEDPPEDEQSECFNEEAERILGKGYAAYVQSLQEEAGLSPYKIAAFELAYERAEHYHKITEQLGGHNFEIQVIMPGTIIAHNALDDDVEVDKDENTSSIEFGFDGKWFRDRPYELIVVSRLDNESEAKWRSRLDDNNR